MVEAPTSALAVRVAAAATVTLALATLVLGSPVPARAAEPQVPPTIEQVSIENVGQTTATVRARIEPSELATQYTVEYGTTPAYGSSEPVSPTVVVTSEYVTQVLHGLIPDTTYHYRLVASNAAGSATTSDHTLSTFGIASATIVASNRSGAVDTQAGSHPYDVTVEAAFAQYEVEEEGIAKPEPGGRLAKLALSLPRGLGGEASALPRCSHEAFARSEFLTTGNCPSQTQVGVAYLNTTFGAIYLPVYNLVPQQGAPAEFGVYAIVAAIQMRVSLSPSAGYGLTVAINNVSQIFPLKAMTLTLWGVPADQGHDNQRGKCLSISEGPSSERCPAGAPPVPLLTLPTKCGDALTTTLQASSWAQPNESVTASAVSEEGTVPANLTGCDRLSFQPTVEVASENASADSSTGVSVDLRLPQNTQATGLAEADLRDITIALPSGVSLNPAAAQGLESCSATQVGLEESAEAQCPDTSRIGTIEVDTPLLEKPLVGSIYLAQPVGREFDDLLEVFLVAQGEGAMLKLPVQLAVNPADGQLVMSLSNAPQLAISQIRLSFDGGPRALLANPAACGTYTVLTRMTPYSAPESGEPSTIPNELDVNQDCTGGFQPRFAAGDTDPRAGARSDFTLQVSRAGGEKYLQGLSVALPPGVAANLASVLACEEPRAAAGACEASSKVGSAVVAAGAGADPLQLTGNVYLTGPHEGAPFGLAIVVQGTAGPFDLGTVVVRATVAMDALDGHLTIDIHSLPQLVDGIPLRIRALVVNVDRPGFMLNPTTCTPREIAATMTAGDGTSAQDSSPFTVVGCSGLAFTPSLTASTIAHTSRTDGAALDLRIAQPQGQANIKSVDLTLPRQLPARLTALQTACPEAVFDANPAACPPRSRIGVGTADSPVERSPLSGPVYLVSHGGRALPNIVVILQRNGLHLELSGSIVISRSNVPSVRFTSLPDLPISSLELDLPAGPASVLTARGSLRSSRGHLCSERPVIAGSFTAQSGAHAVLKVAVAVSGCPHPRRNRHATDRARVPA